MDRLDDPVTNVRLGVRYLRQLQDDLGGNVVLAIAGYNAGPGRAVAWRGARQLEGAIYAESIPIEETREYVKRVMIGNVNYHDLLNGEPSSLTARLGTIAPGRARVAAPQWSTAKSAVRDGLNKIGETSARP